MQVVVLLLALGLAGLALIVAGVHLVLGAGAALIAAGIACLAFAAFIRSGIVPNG